jgi:hypothetical protein
MMCVLSTNLILAFSASNVEKDMACGSVQVCIIFFLKKKKRKKKIQVIGMRCRGFFCTIIREKKNQNGIFQTDILFSSNVQQIPTQQ